MIRAINPDGMAPPFRHYAHAIAVPANARWLSVSGQLGVLPDGTMADGIEAQTEAAWRNIERILEADGMAVDDIVKVVQYLTSFADRDAHMAVRKRFLGDHRPSSTLLFVSSLAQPEWLVEVEVMAAKVD